MGLLDIAVLVMIALFFLSGFYRGFIPSLINMVAYVISWIGAFIGYPILSKNIASIELVSSLQFYIEGAEKVNDFEAAKRLVSSLSDSDITSIMNNTKLPDIIRNAIENNIRNQAFADQNITTVGDYFNTSIYYLFLNIASFVIVFFVISSLLILISNAVNYSANFPQLKLFDNLCGGVVTVIRGFFAMHVVFMVVPLILAFMPASITDILNSSTATSIFYSGNILLPMISAVL